MAANSGSEQAEYVVYDSRGVHAKKPRGTPASAPASFPGSHLCLGELDSRTGESSNTSSESSFSEVGRRMS